MSDLRVGLIGCGSVSEWHLRAWMGVSNACVVALCDVNVDKLRDRAEEFEVLATYSTWDDLLADPNVNAVDICLPHHLHAAAVLAAAKARKHIFVEKPLATTMDDARAMLVAASHHRVQLMVGQSGRFEPEIRTLKQVINSGLLGDLYFLSSRDLGRKEILVQAEMEGSRWKLDPERAGGGVLIRDGIHMLDALRWWTGDAVTRVSAEMSTVRWDVAVETNAHVLLRFAGGAIGSLEMTWSLTGPRIREVVISGSAGTARLVTRGTPTDSHSEIEITSERLTLRQGSANLEALLSDASPLRRQWGYAEYTGPSIVLRRAKGQEFQAELSHFAACVEQGTRPLNDGIEGAKGLAVLLAAYESARTGQTVTPESLECYD